MTKFKRIVAISITALTFVAISTTAFAASTYNTRADVVAALTGKTVESVIAENTESGKAYGTIAKDAGKLTEFKAAMLEMKKSMLAEKVAAGTITQEKSDEIIAAIEKNQINCDGTGSAKIGQKMGAGFGKTNNNGQGKGQGKGLGGAGHIKGNGTGDCTATAQA